MDGATLSPRAEDETDPGRYLSALRVVAPADWRARVRDALTEHRSIPAAATALGVSAGALRAWVKADPQLARVKVATRGRPKTATGVDRADLRELIAAAGGLEHAARALALEPKRLDRYVARGAIPARLLAQLREKAGWSG